MSFQRELNRLASTTGLDAQRVANVLAGTSGKELLFALNKIAGTTGKEFNGVMDLIYEQNSGVAEEIFAQGEGEGGPDADGAISGMSVGSIIVGGFDALVRGFSNGFGGTWAFYDAGGLTY